MKSLHMFTTQNKNFSIVMNETAYTCRLNAGAESRKLYSASIPEMLFWI